MSLVETAGTFNIVIASTRIFGIAYESNLDV